MVLLLLNLNRTFLLRITTWEVNLNRLTLKRGTRIA
jgi:hypothetical protein